MRPEVCRPWRLQLGAFVLGHLEAEARAALQAHLDGCAACRTEAVELAAVANLLATVNPERVGEPPGPPPHLAERVFGRLAEARRAARGRRRAAIVRGVAGVAAVAAVVVAVLVVPSQQGEQVTFARRPPGVEASAYLGERPWGVEVSLRVRGLPANEEYAVWLERADGSRVPAGTFVAVADGGIQVTLAAALPREEAVALGVSDPDDGTLLLARLPPPEDA